MTNCFAGEKWETKMVEKDDMVKLLQELQSRKGVLEEALSTWQERYSDIVDIEGELGMTNFLTPVIQNLNDQKDTTIKPNINSKKSNLKLQESYLSAENPKDDESTDSENSWIYDQYLTTEGTDEDHSGGPNGQYFEVTSASALKESKEENNETLQHLLERLKEARDKVTTKCDEFDDMIADLSKAADESVLLREKAGMTHRSLTLIEMKQEKVMREALYENVTANCTIRKLQEEVIQLRIREAHYQSDIQRLMAENSRLKMKLMEARFHGSTGKMKAKKSASTSILPEEKTETVVPSPPPTGPGLHDIDDLHKPVCVGAIHRGSLSLYKPTSEQSTMRVSDEDLISTASGVRRRKAPCPLCSDFPDADDLEFLDEEKKTRTVGTSTADIENIVAHRRTIVVMGMVLPIPLFLSCLLRTIEESMLMIGRVCFAELPPFDPSFPELHEDVMDALKEMYVKVKQKIR